MRHHMIRYSALLVACVVSISATANGEAYSPGTKAKKNAHLWEDTEQSVHASKELLKERIAAELLTDDSEATSQALNQWSGRQAEVLVELLQELP